MIDRILVVCQTKQDSLKWIEMLRNQIKVCRLPSMTSQQLPQPPHQLPLHMPGTPAAAHVSSPPYLQLTCWIRQALESGDLTIDILRKILKTDYFHSSDSTTHPHFVKRSRHKVECFIFPSREISDKSREENQTSSGIFRRELVLDYEAENPYGFIRYFEPSGNNLDEDEITFLLPGHSRSSSSSSTHSYISSYG